MKNVDEKEMKLDLHCAAPVPITPKKETANSQNVPALFIVKMQILLKFYNSKNMDMERCEKL